MNLVLYQKNECEWDLGGCLEAVIIVIAVRTRHNVPLYRNSNLEVLWFSGVADKSGREDGGKSCGCRQGEGMRAPAHVTGSLGSKKSV